MQFSPCLQHTGSGPYLKTPGNGSVIYCIISDGKHGNLGVCPQSQQWEQLKGLHVAKSHHSSTSLSPKTLPTMSDLTPRSDFPKENLHCRRGLLLCKEGSGGIQEEAGTMKSHSAAAEAKSSVGCCRSAFHVLSFCCAKRTKLKITSPLDLFLGTSSWTGSLCHHVCEHQRWYTWMDGHSLNGPNTLTDFSARRAVRAICAKKHTVQGTVRVVLSSFLHHCSVHSSSTR